MLLASVLLVTIRVMKASINTFDGLPDSIFVRESQCQRFALRTLSGKDDPHHLSTRNLDSESTCLEVVTEPFFKTLHDTNLKLH